MPWDAARYLGFRSERLRPALDLLAQVPLEAPETVVDLGCGPGHVTRLLKARWPAADVTGVDASAAMLERAAKEAPGARWERADAAIWCPHRPVDLVYANASLQWIEDHARLFPRLVGCLAPGGALAVQMPRNHDRPAHRAVFEAAEEGPWALRLAPLLRKRPVAALEDYRAWLEPHAAQVDLWETDYLHRLEGPDPVLAWVRGSLLVPLLEALEPEAQTAFLEACRRRLREAYPPDAAGRTAFRFRRLFLVAERPR